MGWIQGSNRPHPFAVDSYAFETQIEGLLKIEKGLFHS